MDKDFYIQLIHKQITGDISPEENEQLDVYIQSNPDAARLVEEIELTWQLSQPEASVPDVDSTAELAAVMQKLGLKKPTSKVIPFRRNFFRIAAAALVLITAGVFLLRNGSILPEEMIIASASDKTKQVTLPDGSDIWLQPGSTLQYTASFNDKHRDVNLTGTAFFDVQRNENIPFNITAGESNVTVLGTSFQVIQSVSSTAVHVYTGRVRLAADDKESILTKDQAAVYTYDSQTISTISHQQQDELIWKTNRFVFRNINLSQAIGQLESHNQDKITVENIALLNCKVNAVIQTTSSESVLERLSESLDTEVVKLDDHTYVLKGGRCP